MELHESTRTAFQAARRRANVAASIEANLLHIAIYDAREAGMSVRETATALGVPKSTVARHWRVGHHCPSVPPSWGDEREWTAATLAVWAHDPDQREDHVPWRWHGDGSVEAVPLDSVMVTPQEQLARLEESLREDEVRDQAGQASRGHGNQEKG